MNDTVKNKLLRWGTIAGVVFFIAFGGFHAWPEYQRGLSLRQKDAELTRLIERKRVEIERLRDNQRRFHTDADFVETIARQNHRVFPGELVFVFDD